MVSIEASVDYQNIKYGMKSLIIVYRFTIPNFHMNSCLVFTNMHPFRALIMVLNIFTYFKFC